MIAPPLLLLALGTLVSEDLACISAGVLVAQGSVAFFPATVACLAGIFAGDLLLFAAGRGLGRRALTLPLVGRMLSEETIEESSRWFTLRGPTVIALSRVVPGTRLPTYFALGALRTPALRFAGYFLVAAAIWTPLLVAGAMVSGGRMLDSTLRWRAAGIVLALFALFWIATRSVVPLFTWRGRRLLLSAWRRLTRCEFWPPYIFYIPVAIRIALLAIKHRSLSLFTAANPAIPEGGFIGESKFAILRGLSGAGDAVARNVLLPARWSIEEKLAAARAFMAEIPAQPENIEDRARFPVVLKPDVGQRGAGVAVIRSQEALHEYLKRSSTDTILQEYVPGIEFGVFYYRMPDEEKGCIFSITEKRYLSVIGDGTSTLEELILRDDRAVCMARFHLRQQRARLQEVPGPGQEIALAEIGTHCRGAVFTDGSKHLTPELEAEIDRISRTFEGFHFGRYDLKVPTIEDFRAGRNLRIVELNGVTSEATHIYDPGLGFVAAQRVLFRQWEILFEIARRCAERGAKPSPASRLLKLTINGLTQAAV